MKIKQTTFKTAPIFIEEEKIKPKKLSDLIARKKMRKKK